jgi:hypothetical protein
MSGHMQGVMAGLVPAIHVLPAARKTWMRGTKARLRASSTHYGPRMTVERLERDPPQYRADTEHRQLLALVDGPEKVSGRAKYTADLIAPGMLAGRILRSSNSHAEILVVDVSEARKLPGVKAIVTGADCVKTFGVLPIARSEHPVVRKTASTRGAF